MARVMQNRQITLFSLWSFNQNKAQEKNVEIFIEKKKLYD